ncbi:hypothetical protein ACFOWZ_06895 [Lentzea rhizosphaerae]|uniref:Uncharacterized protein n=1 Tax=Lentzea rhizosphaerae TaxID=2041025 RepID=A0ABV8BLL0_9PSEU
MTHAALTRIATTVAGTALVFGLGAAVAQAAPERVVADSNPWNSVQVDSNPWNGAQDDSNPWNGTPSDSNPWNGAPASSNPWN